MAGVSDLDSANAYLIHAFLADWEERFSVPAANPTDAHRPVTKLHDLAASLSHVEARTVTNDYTIQFRGKRYQIAKESISHRHERATGAS